MFRGLLGFIRFLHNPVQQARSRASMLQTQKLVSPHFEGLFTPELRTLISLFEKNSFELRIAGGAVRDILSGKKPSDIDFATTATPQEMKDLFNKEKVRLINTNGESHGTITCRLGDKENFEITTLRVDAVTDGRRAQVEFTRDWEVDACRRDLTFNSLFLGFDGTVYDYCNGIEDLKKKHVRFVGEASERIQEDYLRILRYFRFYGRIAESPDDHDEATLRSIKENMDGLKGISGERIWVEMKKIVLGNHGAALLSRMLALGLGPLLGFEGDLQTDELHTVWTRAIKHDPKVTTVLAALFANEQQVTQLNARVKMSNDELQTCKFIIAHRDKDMEGDPLKFCKHLECELVNSKSDKLKNRDRICELLKYKDLPDILEAYSKWTLPHFPITGITLLQRKLVPKGPILGKVLHDLRMIWKEHEFDLSEQDLLDHVERLKEKYAEQQKS